MQKWLLFILSVVADEKSRGSGKYVLYWYHKHTGKRMLASAIGAPAPILAQIQD